MIIKYEFFNILNYFKKIYKINKKFILLIIYYYFTDGARDWGHMPSMINLPAYLHLCESAEALGSGVACYRLSRT